MSTVLFVSVVVLLAIGMPVAFALMLSAGLAVLVAGPFPVLVVLKEMFTGIDSFPLMAVPFFILAAELMSGGSLTEVLLKFAGQFVGHKRGGLGYTNVVSLTFFSGISGSALAISPSVVTFAVVLWTFLWGVPGAFIGVPLAIAFLTLCAQFPSTEWIATMFSGSSRAQSPAD